jgi:hypothetical protein
MWAILLTLFLGIQLKQVRIKIVKSIKYIKNENLDLLKKIKATIDVDSSLKKRRGRIIEACKNVDSFMNSQNFTSEINELLLFIRSFSLFVSSYYFSLMLVAFYINSSFVYSYISFYFSIFIFLCFLLSAHLTIFIKINNIIAIILFPLLGIILIFIGYTWSIDTMNTIENNLSVAPFTKVIPVVATFLPFYLYVVFEHKVSTFNKKQGKILDDNKDFKNLKDLYEYVEKSQHIILLKDSNERVESIRDEMP